MPMSLGDRIRGLLGKRTGSGAKGTSAQSNTSHSNVGGGTPGKNPSATASRTVDLGSTPPTPLQGSSGPAVPVSSQSGGSNPFSALSSLGLGVGAAGAESPWGSGPGSGPRVSPPTSPSRNPAAVNAGTSGNTAGSLSPATHPNMLTGPSGIFSTLQHTLGSLQQKAGK
jgi:hypothetical protein